MIAEHEVGLCLHGWNSCRGAGFIGVAMYHKRPGGKLPD